jgi:hypothetical protein
MKGLKQPTTIQTKDRIPINQIVMRAAAHRRVIFSLILAHHFASRNTQRPIDQVAMEDATQDSISRPRIGLPSRGPWHTNRGTIQTDPGPKGS